MRLVLPSVFSGRLFSLCRAYTNFEHEGENLVTTESAKQSTAGLRDGSWHVWAIIQARRPTTRTHSDSAVTASAERIVLLEVGVALIGSQSTRQQTEVTAVPYVCMP